MGDLRRPSSGKPGSVRPHPLFDRLFVLFVIPGHLRPGLFEHLVVIHPIVCLRVTAVRFPGSLGCVEALHILRLPTLARL